MAALSRGRKPRIRKPMFMRSRQYWRGSGSCPTKQPSSWPFGDGRRWPPAPAPVRLQKNAAEPGILAEPFFEARRQERSAAPAAGRGLLSYIAFRLVALGLPRLGSILGSKE